jgi:hypothetical protein
LNGPVYALDTPQRGIHGGDVDGTGDYVSDATFLSELSW